MTKQDILDYFNDVNQVYNDSTRLDSLSNMIDEMLETAREKENKYDHNCPYYGGECDYYNIAQSFIDGIIKVMNENHISSVEELEKIFRGRE